MSLVALKLVPNASALEMVAYLFGGPIGIVLSIEAHKLWFKRKYGHVEYEELDTCDHVFNIYGHNPLRSKCSLCGKEHPLSGTLKG